LSEFSFALPPTPINRRQFEIFSFGNRGHFAGSSLVFFFFILRRVLKKNADSENQKRERRERENLRNNGTRRPRTHSADFRCRLALFQQREKKRKEKKKRKNIQEAHPTL
jgi:hypothetical protein